MPILVAHFGPDRHIHRYENTPESELSLMRYDAQSRPDCCPVCGSFRIAEYLYGFVIPSKEIDRRCRAGKIILAGCVRGPDDPRWRCNACRADIHDTYPDPD